MALDDDQRFRTASIGSVLTHACTPHSGPMRDTIRWTSLQPPVIAGFDTRDQCSERTGQLSSMISPSPVMLKRRPSNRLSMIM